MCVVVLDGLPAGGLKHPLRAAEALVGTCPEVKILGARSLRRGGLAFRVGSRAHAELLLEAQLPPEFGREELRCTAPPLVPMPTASG